MGRPLHAVSRRTKRACGRGPDHSRLVLRCLQTVQELQAHVGRGIDRLRAGIGVALHAQVMALAKMALFISSGTRGGPAGIAGGGPMGLW